MSDEFRISDAREQGKNTNVSKIGKKHNLNTAATTTLRYTVERKSLTDTLERGLEVYLRL